MTHKCSISVAVLNWHYQVYADKKYVRKIQHVRIYLWYNFKNWLIEIVNNNIMGKIKFVNRFIDFQGVAICT